MRREVELKNQSPKPMYLRCWQIGECWIEMSSIFPTGHQFTLKNTKSECKPSAGRDTLGFICDIFLWHAMPELDNISTCGSSSVFIPEMSLLNVPLTSKCAVLNASFAQDMVLCCCIRLWALRGHEPLSRSWATDIFLFNSCHVEQDGLETSITW